MIPNQWYAILESREVSRSDRPVGITRLGERMVVWRDQQKKIHVLADMCAHRGAALNAGKLILHGQCIQCPFHGLEYDTTGKCVVIPANGRTATIPEYMKVKAYPVQEKCGLIFIWWGELSPTNEYPSLPFFEDIDEKFPYSTFVDHWPVHYSRAIENQLDLLHLPFVHRSTIGASQQTIVDGPRLQANEKELFVWYENRKEDGGIAKKVEEMPQNADHYLLHFRFPNLWQNWLMPKMRVLLAFVPVDESNTLIYMRYYQKFIRLPGLRALISWIGKVSSIVILRQDKRVVVTQRPIKSQLHMGEKLVPGDNPILVYRRIRQQLQDAEKRNI